MWNRPGRTFAARHDWRAQCRLGAQQTPTFFVNGKAPASADPQALADLVASEVAASNAL